MQPVMVALGVAAGIAANWVLARRAVDDGGLVLGVAHARGGQLGPDGLQSGPQLGGNPATKPRHPVDVLPGHGQRAPARPVLIRELAVGVEAVGQPVSQPGQLIRPKPGRQPGQVGFGLLAGLDVDKTRQPMQKPPDHLHVRTPDASHPLGLRRRGQQRRQLLTGQHPPLAQIGCLGHSPRGLAAGDMQPVGQHPG